jgi:hypothetical protein
MSAAAKTAVLVACAFLAGVLFTAAWVSDSGADARMLADMKQEIADMRQAYQGEIDDMRQAQKAIEEKVAMTEEAHMNTTETARRLANIFVASTTMSKGIGCYGITADATLDMASQDCDSKYCPDCFYFSGSSAIGLTINNCHTSKWTQSGLEMGSDNLATAVRTYTFINLMATSSLRVTITDGNAIRYVIGAKQSMVAFCHTGVSGQLHFPYNPIYTAWTGCPAACDATTPSKVDGVDFSNVVHPSATITCSTSVTSDNSGSTTSNLCTQR